MSLRNPFSILVLAAFGLLTISGLVGCTPASTESAKPVAPDNLVPVTSQSATELDLKTEAIARRTLSSVLHVTGRIQAEVSKEIDINPRFTGRVVALKVRLGDHVKAGQELVRVDSQEISTLQAELIEAQSKYEIAKAHENREKQIYQEHLQRPKDLLAAQAEFEQIKVRLHLAEAENKRIEELYKEKIAAAKDFQAAKANVAQLRVQYRESEILLQREQGLFKNKAILMRDMQLAHAETMREQQHLETLKQRLVLLGVPQVLVATVISQSKILPSVPIVSPTAGVVTAQTTGVGELVSPDKRMIVVTDLSTVVMSADIPEVDVSQIRANAPVEIKVAAFPKEKFHGVISFVGDSVNPTTRTIPIRASLDNATRKLKTNMFAEINLPGAPVEVLSCPESAIQDRAGTKVVYVKTANGFEEHRIELGRDFGQYAEVLSGLNEGEQVATQGSLLLRTAMANKQAAKASAH